MPTPILTPLPFAMPSTGWIRLSQGFGGSVSHDDELFHSLDFPMANNTAVRSLGVGQVVALRETVADGAGSSTGLSDLSNGPSRMGNFVTIYYAQFDLYVTYAHLRLNGVVPTLEGPNSIVSENQIIGYTGNTGYRFGPHLHIQYGFERIYFATGWVADGSQAFGTPVVFDTANGTLGPGIVAQVSVNLLNISFNADQLDQHNIFLLGSQHLNGFGDSFGNIISGNRGDNLLTGGLGGDTIMGGAGYDNINGGPGNDTLYGGAGIDALDYTTSLSSIRVNLSLVGLAQSIGGANGVDVISGFEAVLGSNFADIISGDSLDNYIIGYAGNDTIVGGSGRDFLDGGLGSDSINGGLGVDIVVYTTSDVSARVNLQTGIAFYVGNSAVIDTLASVEDVICGNGDDLITGSSAANYIFAGPGFDTIVGSLGSDRLEGGDGRDVFVFNFVDDSSALSPDTILAGGMSFPFELPISAFGAFEGAGSALGDRIDLSGIDANTTLAGNQMFRLGLLGIGTLSLVNSGTVTIVRANVDYDSEFEFVLRIEDGSVVASAYTSMDFVL